MLAQRTDLFSTSGTARARAAAKAAAMSGREIIDLSAGEILCQPPPSLCAAAIAAIEAGVNRYTDTIGIDTLRQAIAQRLAKETGLSWGADEIVVTAGAKQALFNTAMALLDPGDEVVIPSPYWTTFPTQVTLAGAHPIFVPTADTGYLPSVKEIEAALTPATKAIIINTPNNPTGAVYSRALLAELAALAIKHRLWVVSDECYRSFVFEPNRHESIVAIAPEIRDRLIIVDSFSKSLALTGWRLGYLAGPRAVIAAVKALQSHTTSNPNVIAQHAVLGYLQSGDDDFERSLLARLALARRRGREILSRMRLVATPEASGGFYFYLNLGAFLSVRGGHSMADAGDAANVLLERAGVAGVSGTAFGDPHGLRLSYGVPIEDLERGLGRVVEFFNENEDAIGSRERDDRVAQRRTQG